MGRTPSYHRNSSNRKIMKNVSPEILAAARMYARLQGDGRSVGRLEIEHATAILLVANTVLTESHLKPLDGAAGEIVYGDLKLDQALHRLRGPSGETSLPTSEVVILAALIHYGGRPIRPTVLQHIGCPRDGGTASLRVRVGELRKYMRQTGTRCWIPPAHSIGYRILEGVA
jgi:DNA-binding response OmpR family regulator